MPKYIVTYYHPGNIWSKPQIEKTETRAYSIAHVIEIMESIGFPSSDIYGIRKVAS